MTDLLYHYTDEAGIRGIFDSQCLWATKYCCLNDPKEIREIIAHINKFSKKTRGTRGNVKYRSQFCDYLKSVIGNSYLDETTKLGDSYVTCFSENSDSHFMWEKEKREYAICFDKVRLNELVKQEDTYFLGAESVYQVIYDDDMKNRILDAWEKEYIAIYISNDPAAKASFIRRAKCLPALFKDGKYWRHQQEWRIILRRPVVENIRNKILEDNITRKSKPVYLQNGKYIIKLFEDNYGALNQAVTAIVIGSKGTRKVADEIIKAHNLTNIEIIYSQWNKEGLAA